MLEGGEGQTVRAPWPRAQTGSLINEDNPQTSVTDQNRKRAPHHGSDSQQPQCKRAWKALGPLNHRVCPTVCAMFKEASEAGRT